MGSARTFPSMSSMPIKRCKERGPRHASWTTVEEREWTIVQMEEERDTTYVREKAFGSTEMCTMA